MSRCLRYQNAAVCDYLASQYVVGHMTNRVKKRVEALRQYTPELNQAIAHWSDQTSVLQHVLPEANISSEKLSNIWQSVYAEVNEPSHSVESQRESSLWESLLAWKCIAGFSSLASLFLVAILFVQLPPQVIQTDIAVAADETPLKASIRGPSYLANMVAHNAAEGDIQFVVTAYAKTQDEPSRLHVQWSKDHLDKQQEGLHLWAEDRETGALTYIGQQPQKSSNSAWHLTKPTWLAVSNSGRLLVTANADTPDAANTLFSGLCLQLNEWKA